MGWNTPRCGAAEGATHHCTETTMVSVSAWMVKQMLQASENTASTAPHRFNPRPPGVVRANSATYAVYALLSANPKRCFNHAQIVSATRSEEHTSEIKSLLRN